MRSAYWELSVSGKLRSPVVCGRKHCSHCGRWRHICDFDGLRRRHGRPCAFCITCRRRRQREAYANATPQQRERKREYSAIYGDARRREQGIAARTWRTRATVVDDVERILLPVEPLVDALERFNQDALAALAVRAGVSAKTLQRYRNGESAQVRLDVADRLAVAMGLTSSLIWAEQW